MSVRAATPADSDDIYRLLSAFATSHRPSRSVFDSITFPQALEAATEGRAEFLVSVRESRVVGYVFAVRMPTLFASGTVLGVLELTVDAPLRGGGTGTALIRAVQTRAGEAGDIEVTVPTRRAADFYRRLGFSETAAYLKWPTT